jgi:endonuclease VIII
MPEGDTVWRAARHLNDVLAGAVVTTWDIRVPAFATSDLTGERIEGVVSRGKHLLHRVGDFSLHSHLKMEGSWHLYQPGSRWKRPAFQARALVGSAEWLSVGFELGIVELIAREDEHTVVGHLGPDLLGDDWNPAEALARLEAAPERPTAVALLDQRNLAGIGNLYKVESLFVLGVHPWARVADVPDLPALVERARALMRANLHHPEQNTTGDPRRGRDHWVFGRRGKPCRRCGTAILLGEQGPHLQERVTWWCPRCQAARSPIDPLARTGEPGRPKPVTVLP